MSDTRTMLNLEDPHSLLNESGKSRYKMGEWEDMEEDYALEAMDRALEKLRQLGKIPPKVQEQQK